MTMHQGLDLSRFKKVSSDKKTTTLRHSKGHEIKIAHSGLTPKMKEHLDSLPAHDGKDEKPKMYADTEAEVGSPEDDAPEAPDEAPDTPEAAAQPLDDASPAPAEDAPEAAPEEPAAAPEPAAPAAAPAPAEQPILRHSITPVAPAPAPPGRPTLQDLNAQDGMFAQDLSLGHIQPKTYEDLFAKKDTIGKISTLFGMLLSGAGSGLAHQSSAMLDIMNKEIDRDLDAQKASNSNAQNWYQMNLAHQKQMREAPLIQAQTQQVLTGNYQTATEADYKRAQLAQLNDPNIDVSASNNAKNQMMMAYAQSQQDVINKMPQGPQRAAAQARLDGEVKPGIAAKAMDNNAKTVGHAALVDAVKGKTKDGGAAPAPDAEKNGVNYKKLNHMIHDAQVRASSGFAAQEGGLSKEDIPVVQQEARDIVDNRSAMARYDHAFKKILGLKDRGLLNEEAVKAEIGSLSPELGRLITGRFNQKESETQTGGMFPNWKDWLSGAAPEKYNNQMQWFKDREKAATTINRFPGLVGEPPKFDSPFEKKKAAAAAGAKPLKEGETGEDIHGNPWKVVGGKRVYQ